MTQIAINGIHLNAEASGHGPPLLLLHGFTGSAQTWRTYLNTWRDFTTIAVDLIGHGASDSPPDSERYRMERCVEDLLSLLDILKVGQTALLGYSMGGRVALRLALAAPERFSALILESASPGIEDARERNSRRHSDYQLADRIERDGIDSFVDHWQSIPLFESQARLPEQVLRRQREQRLKNSPRGLANSLRGMGTGEQEPALPRLVRLQMPALIIAGELDERYCRAAREMTDRLPNGRLEIVGDCGHAVHLEQPEVFGTLISGFLKETLAGETSSVAASSIRASD